MSMKMTGGKKWTHTFNKNRVQMTINENLKESTDVVVGTAVKRYTPVGTRPKPGQKRLIQTIRREQKGNGAYVFNSRDYSNVSKYKGSFVSKGGQKSRYTYNGSKVTKNRNKYRWFHRSYLVHRPALLLGLTTLHKVKKGRVVK